MEKEIQTQVADFFNRYPNAEVCYTSGAQVFHANAKDTADARSAYYGLTTVEHKNPKNANKTAVVDLDKLVTDLVVDGTEDVDKAELAEKVKTAFNELSQNTEGGKKETKAAKKPAKNTKS
jgi:hypothetical protein